ncbi:pentatricopeptide repeat-containing protein At4g13650-like [Cryptomeria japonica]|uniref:pentatricopeptide repeat-containing protein At4g13650-like n=1 Tax=Cryptomeria japonica TaxID=3369 RepID=UPI0027DA38CD|nr:pentatricopeptide repeat-containing protein At4g13650-like [Cryptomeria japonica]
MQKCPPLHRSQAIRLATRVTFHNKLIYMYVKCGSLVDARKVFNHMKERDSVSWNTIIAAYKRHGFPQEAVTLFYHMQQTGLQPDKFTFASVLPACAKMGALEQGMDIHQSIMEGGFLSDTIVGNALVDVYAKCGSIDKACELFERMPQRDVISWNAMIAGYAHNGFVEKALETFKQMQSAGVKPSSTTFVSILPACAKMGALDQGMDIHHSIKDRGILSDVGVATALVDMYAKCRSIDKAREIFDKMPRRDVVSWTAMIAGYAQNGFVENALETLKEMQSAGVKPDSATFASILSSCAKMGFLEQGMDIHKSMKDREFLSDVIVATTLVDMYAKCGMIDKAHELFCMMPQKNVYSWTAMIAGYVQNGLTERALEAFKQMQLTGVKPNSTTFASILPACAKMGALEHGINIHQNIKDEGILSDVVVATALIDMYAKCGSLDKARELFDRMPQKNVFSWTAMIAGYAQNGFVEKALETFKQMQSAGIKPDSTTFASVLPACAKMGALEQGMDIHKSIKDRGILSDVVVATALVDMYSKCGSIGKARELFDSMPQRDVISWNAMIAGYAQNGFSEDALKIFELMEHSGTYPDIVSFACVLCACSYAGLVHNGCTYFTHMSSLYCITPTVDHYVCMVDLLGRAGYLEDSLNFIIKMPVKPVVVVWMCFLGACKSHMNIGLGVFTATLLFDLDPKNVATYVLLSNIYAEVGRWDEVQMVRRLMKDEGIKKIPGCSWIEDHGMVHAFCVGDRSHPQSKEIYAMLEKLAWEMKAAGYFPNSRHLLNAVEEEEKELFLCHHSEKLAIAFGLLSTASGTTIRVVKNLRVCADCHTATKFISKIVAREIVVRDANRFHHFKQGQCSCGDYWRQIASTDTPCNVGEIGLEMKAKGFRAYHWQYHSDTRRLSNTADFQRFGYSHQMPLPSTSHLNVTTLCRDGQLKEALHILLTTHNPPEEFHPYLQLLQTCVLKNALSQGENVHAFIAHRRFAFATQTTFHNKLIYMYVKCGSLVDARKVFDHMNERDGVSWNTLITAYRRRGYPQEAVTLFRHMQQTGLQPDQFTFASVLPACAKMGALGQGMDIHQSIKDRGFLSDVVVATALVDMYAKCGNIDKARELFDRMPQRNVFTWNAMIAGYAQNGFVEKSLQTFKQMQLSGVKPDSITFASVLPACAKMGALEQGIDIHQNIEDRGFFSDVTVATALVDMYSKCGSIDKARELFDRMPKRSVVSWTAMISGYTQNGFDEMALETFKQMQSAGVKPDLTTFASILPACAKMGALEQGMDIHHSIKDRGVLSDIVVATALVDMYAKCGSMDNARELFDKMPQRDVISWNAMIAGYVQNGFVEKALEIFKQMQLIGIKPDSTTYASILPTCAKMGALEQGRSIHQSVKDRGMLSDVVVATALVDMYAKCGSIDKACELFDTMPQRNEFSWTAMIAGYAQNGFDEKALETFRQMQLSGVKPNSTTFASVLPACAKIGDLEQGMGIHQSIIDRGLLSDVVVTTALIDMYAKCGSIDKAYELFNKMPQRNVVSWTAMIAGYAQNGFVEKALDNFKQMQLAGVAPDSSTFASIFLACAKAGALEHGMDIHQSIKDTEILSDVVVATALVNMYAKCGSIDRARELFDRISKRDIISWNAMIAGYAQNGLCKDALKIFELMKNSGTFPDIVSFSCVLCACSHAGLVDEGCTYFNHISNSYCITPTVDHYVCLVDLLARAGYLEDSLNFIIKMPVKPAVVVWMCFLGACRSYKNMGLGVFTATLLFDLDPKNAATYVLLSNMYAEVGRWDEVQMVRRLMKDTGIKKIPGFSWIEGHKMVHAFCVGDRSYPQAQEIHAELD